MGIKDIERIMKGLPKSEIDNLPDEKLPLILEIASWAANAMLSRILGFLGLDEDAARLLWNWISSLWNSLLMKVAPNNPRFQTAERVFRRRMEQALKDYLDGEDGLLERLIKDLGGV